MDRQSSTLCKRCVPALFRCTRRFALRAMDAVDIRINLLAFNEGATEFSNERFNTSFRLFSMSSGSSVCYVLHSSLSQAAGQGHYNSSKIAEILALKVSPHEP